MLKHDFIAVEQSDVQLAINFYPEKNINSACWKRVAFSDTLVRRYISIFKNIQVYNIYNQNGNQLDYYGTTIFPPSSVKELQSRIDALSVWKKVRFFPLKRTLDFAVKKGFFVVHIGI